MAGTDNSEMKQCRKCLESKPLDQFPNGKGRMGKESRCKKCKRAYDVEYLSRPGVAEHYIELNKRLYEANMSKIRAQQLARHHNRKHEPARRAASRLRAGIYTALRGIRKSRPTFDLLGYNKSDLASHLERQFVAGMSWDNADSWHIDHIVPISYFVRLFGNAEQAIVKAWALSNLRPIWALENLQKHSKRLHLI